jgi:AcrR family transcriptional regulator
MEKKKYHHGDLKNSLIQAGKQILAREGVSGLSLRKVARQAGVSHAAPYAHFTDKQALIAAISTDGFQQLYDKLAATIERHRDDPQRQLIESAWMYIQFAVHEPDTFKIMFSGVLEREKDYPAFVDISQRTFKLVEQIVAICQQMGVLRPGAADVMAVVVWGLVHGIISLVTMGQVSHTILNQYDLRRMLIFGMDQITLTPYRQE